MTIEFCKERGLDGSSFWYCTRRDGRFVDGSLSRNENEAEVIFDRIVKDSELRKSIEEKEVIKIVEI